MPTALAKTARAILLTGLLQAAAASALLAQQTDPPVPPAGSIHGTVIDAASSEPLPNAVVTLLPAGGNGAFPPERSGAVFTNARHATTGLAGGYVFTGLAPGEYSLLIQRGGYAPARVDVTLGASGDARLSIGLVVRPVQLQAVKVESSRTPSVLATGAAIDGSERVAAALDRQTRFLATDVREITRADMHESVVLGSNDVLRSLQRLPGVSHDDDWSARLLVRGNRWDHTRVYFDDMPLFQPLGSLGTQSSIGADAIGAAFLLPGVRPVSMGDDGAARIDIRSAPGVADGKVHGAGELAYTGFSGAVGLRRSDDAAGLHLSGRKRLGCVGQGCTSYSYDEYIGRADLGVGSGRLEASALQSQDERTNGRDGFYGIDYQSWHNRAGRLSYAHGLGGISVSHRVATSRFGSLHVLRGATIRDSTSPIPSFWMTQVWSGAKHLSVGSRIGSMDSTDRWTIGYDVTQFTSYFGGTRQTLLWGELAGDDTSGQSETRYVSLWGERRWRSTERLTMESGIRLDVGGAGLRAVRPAPSLVARYEASPTTVLSAGLSRVHQYVQQLPLPTARHGRMVSGLWIAADGRNPLLVVDQATAGIEHWRGDGILLGANAYARRSGGSALLDPTPGTLVGRPFHVTGTERAHGAELSARKLTGRVTGLLAYSYGVARSDAVGYTFAAPSDRTHALDAAATYRLGGWRLGTAWTLSSGSPFTRWVPGTVARDDDDTLEWIEPPAQEAPNAARTPFYSSLDLSLEWTRAIKRTRLTVFGTMQNVLLRDNETWFSPGVCFQDDFSATACRDGSTYAPSRLYPTVGMRLAF